MAKSDINNITLPVYKRLHKELEDVEAEIPTAIQADKDILSKMVYSSEDNSLTFPKNVEPILYYSEYLGYTLYFNYGDEVIVDGEGNILGEITYNDNILVVHFTETFEPDLEWDNVTYVLFNVNPETNWYDILNLVSGNATGQMLVKFDEDNDQTLIIFPKYVLPLRMFDSVHQNEFYFSYEDKSVIDSFNSPVVDTSVDFEGNHCVVSFAGQVSLFISDLCFIYFNNIEDIFENTYYLFHPIKSSGTKLYKHKLQLSGSGETVWVIDTDATPITALNDSDRIGTAISVSHGYSEATADKAFVRCSTVGGSGTEVLFVVPTGQSTVSLMSYALNGYTTYPDEVTPL